MSAAPAPISAERTRELARVLPETLARRLHTRLMTEVEPEPVTPEKGR